MAASEHYVDFVLVEDRPTLRRHFALLDEGVEAIVAHCPQETLTGADLYVAGVDGSAHVRLIRLDEQVVGFMATYVSVALTGERTLFVWLLYLEPGLPDLMGDVVAELDLMVLEYGCSATEFHTTRPAWERRLARHGFEPYCIQFRKAVEVTNG